MTLLSLITTNIGLSPPQNYHVHALFATDSYLNERDLHFSLSTTMKPSAMTLSELLDRSKNSNQTVATTTSRTKATASTSASTAVTLGTNESLSKSFASIAQGVDKRADEKPSPKRKLVKWGEEASSNNVVPNQANETIPTCLERSFDRLEVRHNKAIRTEDKLTMKDDGQHQCNFKCTAPQSVSAEYLPAEAPNSPPTAKKLSQLRKSMQRLESQIQDAARVELDYLNEYKSVKEKRESWTSTLRLMTDKLQKRKDRLARKDPLATSNSSIEELQNVIVQVESKIRKAERMETTYLNKSKELRHKRYRWTQLYEHTSRQCGEEQQQSSSPSRRGNGRARLPPLLTQPPFVDPTTITTESTRSYNPSSERFG